MAASIALLNATPYSLKYEYTHDGSGSSVVYRSQTQMVADMASAAEGPSPLKDLLSQTYSNLAWGALKANAKTSIYVTNEVNTAGTTVAAIYGVNGATNSLACTGVNANAGTAIIEVRFHHSFDR